jgi:hypothetical protein
LYFWDTLAIIEELKPIDRNWRTGNFKKTYERARSQCCTHVTIGDDYIAAYYDQYTSKVLEFVHRKSQEVISRMEIPRGSSAVTNTEIVVGWDAKHIKILDIYGQLISEIPELDEDERLTWNLASCCLSDDHVAVLSRTPRQEKLSLWDVSDPLRVTQLKSQHFNLNLPFGIFISSTHNGTTRFYFFWKKTLNLHWQKRFDRIMKGKFSYGKGLLLVYVSKFNDQSKQYGAIQVYDGKSRTYLREMRTTAKTESGAFEHMVGFNSKFMVVMESSRYERQYMKIYDLDAVKNPKRTQDELLVHTLALKFHFDGIGVTETEIFSQGGHTIRILDFSSFSVFQNEAKSVTLSLPWRSVWRSKGVDEEPLQPARHMGVYKEVLKYFHELSMNCQTAIKCYRLDGLFLPIFTVGDDSIGYIHRNKEMTTYYENMDKRSHEMNQQGIFISKTTHLSVMGKTIQLIDSATGMVINEIKLTRDAIGWHFNWDLLVCVHKIAEQEHLLSVWRISHSSHFTHLKDVAIGYYDGSLLVDEQFIAVETSSYEKAGTKTYNFISMRTFKMERSLTSRSKYFEYDGGYLFVLKKRNMVGILDVASGAFLRDIRIKPSKNYQMIFRVNSKYVVMINLHSKELYVYDLKCLKETDTVPSHLLLTTIELKCEVKKVLMNETRIVCLSDKNMYVVDLKPIDRLRCPESC